MASRKTLTDYKVLQFDVYGTLIDWESGIYDALQPLLTRFPVDHSANIHASESSNPTRSAKQTWTRPSALRAFASVERDLQAKHPTMSYSILLEHAHAELESRLQALTDANSEVAAEDRHRAFAASIAQWTPFPDTVRALRVLSAHFALVVLSNVDRNAFAWTHAKLAGCDGDQAQIVESPFSLILTAQDVGAYKPSFIAFERALDVISGASPNPLSSDSGNGSSDPASSAGPSGDPDSSPLPANVLSPRIPTLSSKLATLRPLSKSDVLVVAQSIEHDHTPARALGLAGVWIDRAGSFIGSSDGDEDGGKKYTWRFETLGEMADAVELAIRKDRPNEMESVASHNHI